MIPPGSYISLYDERLRYSGIAKIVQQFEYINEWQNSFLIYISLYQKCGENVEAQRRLENTGK
jgi:hypothetical protein